MPNISQILKQSSSNPLPFQTESEENSVNNFFTPVKSIAIAPTCQFNEVDDVRNKILIGLECGIHGAIEMVVEILREVQKKNRRRQYIFDLRVDFVSLRQGLMLYVNNLTERHLHLFFRELDKNCSGYILLVDFINWLFGTLQEDRLLLVSDVFQGFSSSLDGRANLAEICSRYNAQHHLDVVNGKKREIQVMQEFVEILSIYDDGDSAVSLHAFIEYHRALSICIMQDDEFTEIVNRLWGNAAKLEKQLMHHKCLQGESIVLSDASNKKPYHNEYNLTHFEDSFISRKIITNQNTKGSPPKVESPLICEDFEQLVMLDDYDDGSNSNNRNTKSRCSSNDESKIFSVMSPFGSCSTKTLVKRIKSSDQNVDNYCVDNLSVEIDDVEIQGQMTDVNWNKNKGVELPKSMAEINRKKMMTSSIQF
eukprot:TRINITY_DN3040_c0_g1_i1.p1 TRINITY_DN3040_c0_g1~~TRINITY_DN3040_c0_g1_i1.p1  ORF type:complete len:423 (+),score=39.20 TRINITY_DN3040_c0_g1_i1:137-1405(+)